MRLHLSKWTLVLFVMLKFQGSYHGGSSFALSSGVTFSHLQKKGKVLWIVLDTTWSIYISVIYKFISYFFLQKDLICSLIFNWNLL